MDTGGRRHGAVLQRRGPRWHTGEAASRRPRCAVALRCAVGAAPCGYGCCPAAMARGLGGTGAAPAANDARTRRLAARPARVPGSGCAPLRGSGQRPWPWPQRPGREHWRRAQTRRVQPWIRSGTSTARGALRGSATARRRLRLAGSRPQPPAGAAPAPASARARPSGAHPGAERDPCKSQARGGQPIRRRSGQVWPRRGQPMRCARLGHGRCGPSMLRGRGPASSVSDADACSAGACSERHMQPQMRL